MPLRRALSGLAALCAACSTSESLGMASFACDGGVCLAPSVIADGATVDTDGGPELLRVAHALEGTFVGGLFAAVPLKLLEDSLLTLQFMPDDDPLTGRYTVECTGSDCTLLFGLGFGGHYFLTGLNPLGRVKGYLVIEGGDLNGAREVQSLYIDGDDLMLLLGDPTPPFQVIVVASRAASDGGGAEGTP